MRLIAPNRNSPMSDEGRRPTSRMAEFMERVADSINIINPDVAEPLSHSELSDIGSNSHAQIDALIAGNVTDIASNTANIAANAANITANRALIDANTAARTLDIVTVTATTFTVGDQDVVLVDDDTAGGVVTITLSTSRTKVLYLKKIGSTANVVIDGNGSETIDGDLTQTLSVQYEALTIIKSGAAWFIL